VQHLGRLQMPHSFLSFSTPSFGLFRFPLVQSTWTSLLLLDLVVGKDPI
jgi:hypothetical protein